MATLRALRWEIEKQLHLLVSSSNCKALFKVALCCAEEEGEVVPGVDATEVELYDFIVDFMRGEQLQSLEDQGMARLLTLHDLVRELTTTEQGFTSNVEENEETVGLVSQSASTSVAARVQVAQTTGGSAHYEEGQSVKVDCDPGLPGTLTFWFRVNDDGAKFLFTVKNKDVKASDTEYTVNSHDKVSLTIQSFKKKTDSGVYTCAAMNSNKLFFGKPSVITGKPDQTTQPPKIATTAPKPFFVTKSPCTCKKQEPKPHFNCETWILSSLASGCALLLILLIVTVLYCIRLRTRQCSHKRQPQTRPADHSELLDIPF